MQQRKRILGDSGVAERENFPLSTQGDEVTCKQSGETLRCE